MVVVGLLSMGLDRLRALQKERAGGTQCLRQRPDPNRAELPMPTIAQLRRRAAPADRPPQLPVLRRGQPGDLRPRVRPAPRRAASRSRRTTPSWSRPTARRSASAAQPIEGFAHRRAPRADAVDRQHLQRRRAARVRQAASASCWAGETVTLRRRTEDRRRGHVADLRERPVHRRRDPRRRRARRRRHAQPQDHPRACRCGCTPTSRRRCSRCAARCT